MRDSYSSSEHFPLRGPPQLPMLLIQTRGGEGGEKGTDARDSRWRTSHERIQEGLRGS